MKKFLLISTLMVYTMSVFSATREIKGLVTSDEDNMPLIGASVFVSTDDLKKINYPKESIGVMTAIDGSFIINVPDNITRIFCSYLGHNQKEIKLGKEKFYNIKLESSSHELDNVVVTGYQMWHVRNILNLKKMFINVPKYVLAGLIMFIVVNRVCMMLDFTSTIKNILAIAAEIGLGVVVYGGILLLLKPTIIYKANDIVSRIKNRKNN